MQLGLYRTTLAAARLWSSAFKVYRRGKMTSSGMKSRHDGNSLTDKERGRPQSWNASQVAYEEEFPQLSANNSSMQGKRRTRIDLHTPPEQKSRVIQKIGPEQLEASTSISNQNDTDLPTSFVKDYSSSSRNSKLRQNCHEHGEARRISMSSFGTSVDEPFDMRPPETRESEQKSRVVQNIGPLQLEASTLISNQNDTNLPTSFGKNRSSSSRNPKLRQYYHEHGEAKRSSTSSFGTSVDEPFDICPPETRESNTLRSSTNAKNSGKWAPKVQSAEENEQNQDNMENNNNIENSVQQPRRVLKPGRSSMNGKNRGMWVPNVESAEETEQNQDNMENKSNIENSVQEPGQVLRPGMVLFKHYIPLAEQVDIVNRCRELGLGRGGFYRPGFDDGAKLRLYMMCLGLDWNAQTKTYGERRRHDNVAPPDIPHEFNSLVSRVLHDSHTVIKKDLKTMNVEDILPTMSPDVCIVNFYTTNGRLGLHQDRDESPESLQKGLPVVSISIGDSGEFLYGDRRDVDKAEQVLLQSGDVLIFGGESRHIFHGVKTIIPDTAPPALLKETNLRPGRLNLTFREY